MAPADYMIVIYAPRLPEFARVLGPLALEYMP